MSSVLRRLQCCTRRNKDLQGLKVKILRICVFIYGCRYGRCGVVCHSPVSDFITTGEVEMLESVEVRYSLCYSTVADARAVAESQAGEAAAVPRYRRQAGIGDLWQHGEGQTVEVCVAHHLGRREKQCYEESRFLVFCIPAPDSNSCPSSASKPV